MPYSEVKLLGASGDEMFPNKGSVVEAFIHASAWLPIISNHTELQPTSYTAYQEKPEFGFIYQPCVVSFSGVTPEPGEVISAEEIGEACMLCMTDIATL